MYMYLLCNIMYIATSTTSIINQIKLIKLLTEVVILGAYRLCALKTLVTPNANTAREQSIFVQLYCVLCADGYNMVSASMIAYSQRCQTALRYGWVIHILFILIRRFGKRKRVSLVIHTSRYQ